MPSKRVKRAAMAAAAPIELPKIGYDEAVNLGNKAGRLNAIGVCQANILNQLREERVAMQFAGIQFIGNDASRIMMTMVRVLEEMAQEARKELEDLGVTFPPPAKTPDKAPAT